jgi:hypothetical protein
VVVVARAVLHPLGLMSGSRRPRRRDATYLHVRNQTQQVTSPTVVVAPEVCAPGSLACPHLPNIPPS